MNESIDPYRAPETNLRESGAELALTNAGKGRRFLTYVVDYVGLMLMVFVTGVVLALAGAADWLVNLGTGGEYLFGIGAMIVYYLLFEGLFARTPGKLVCGTRVVDEHGGPPSFGQVLGRTFSRFIPFEPFSLLFGSEGKGWHDTLAKTRVVLTR